MVCLFVFTFQLVAQGPSEQTAMDIYYGQLATRGLDINTRPADCDDVSLVTAYMGLHRGDARWDSRVDLNNDGVVDENDLAIVMNHLPKGTECK